MKGFGFNLKTILSVILNILFDDCLIQKDGCFMHRDLLVLNPEH